MPMATCSMHGRRWHVPGDPPRCATCAHGTATGDGGIEELIDALAGETTADLEHRDPGDDVPNWG